MEITNNNLHKAIAALRQCAKENKGKQTDTGCVVVSDLCTDVANYLEKPDANGLPWHTMDEEMPAWHTCLLVHEKSYCIVRRHDDGQMYEITMGIEVKEGDPYHLIKWIDLVDIAKL